jgi:uncharacterized protein (TIGR03435 family)
MQPVAVACTVPCNSFVCGRARAWRSFRLIFATGFLASAVYGQTAPHPRFEVASVKPGGDIFSTRPDRTAGRIRWTTQLCYLIGYAHRLDFSRVSGPKCGSVYSVEATFDPAATDDQVRLMIQSLLTERFKLRTHRATTEAEGYALVIGKGELKIRKAQVADEPPGMPERAKDASSAREAESYISATMPDAGSIAIKGRRVTMSQLAETLQRVNEMPVWDRTGLQGNYDFAFRYAQVIRADLETDAPSLATALQENLGLKLEKRKGPVQTLVIDYIDEPSEN